MRIFQRERKYSVKEIESMLEEMDRLLIYVGETTRSKRTKAENARYRVYFRWAKDMIMESIKRDYFLTNKNENKNNKRI